MTIIFLGTHDPQREELVPMMNEAKLDAIVARLDSYYDPNRQRRSGREESQAKKKELKKQIQAKKRLLSATHDKDQSTVLQQEIEKLEQQLSWLG